MLQVRPRTHVEIHLVEIPAGLEDDVHIVQTGDLRRCQIAGAARNRVYARFCGRENGAVGCGALSSVRIAGNGLHTGFREGNASSECAAVGAQHGV